MKKFGLLIIAIVIILFSDSTFGQIWVEHFDYDPGSLVSVSFTGDSVWNWHSGTYGQVDVIDTDSDTGKSLRYTDLYNWTYNPSAGRRIVITEAESEDVGRNLDQLYTSNSIYISFLMKVITLPSGGGTYFLHTFQGTIGTTFGSTVWIKPNSTNFQIGINARTTAANTVWYTTDLSLNLTYLVVVKYEFVTGTGNDVASLFINPSITGAEPSPTVTHTNTGGTDLTSIGRVALRQSLSSGNGMGTIEIDEIRVATSWSDAPLPVELSSFSASVISNGVKLSWRTETETNNYGFEILRSAQNDNWEKIGFVEGYGNSNSPKDYTFTDASVSSGTYSYRLKQIDNDGTFSYSKIIEVDLGAPDKYELAQNFPNPFNPNTSIRFTLPETGNVKLTVFNLLGQEVATLVNGVKEAGTHIINFDAEGLNSGVYIYRIESGSFNEVRKMTLIK